MEKIEFVFERKNERKNCKNIEKINKDKLNNTKDKLIDVIYSNTSLPKDVIFKLLRKKDVRVNGVRVNKNVDVYPGDVITFFQKENVVKKPYTIVFENEDFVVLDKMFNIETVGENSVETFLKKDKNLDFFPVHRLDRNTTGLVIFARTKTAQKQFISLFENNKVVKKYLSVVVGKTNFKDFEKDLFLFTDKKKSLSFVKDVKDSGYSKINQKINTVKNFTCRKGGKDYNFSLIDVEIESGKTHQIRASLKYLGHPVLGDGKYGDYSINSTFNLKYQLLNSSFLKFEFMGETYSFKSKYDLLSNLQKYFT